MAAAVSICSPQGMVGGAPRLPADTTDRFSCKAGIFRGSSRIERAFPVDSGRRSAKAAQADRNYGNI